jgi:hypothetical protein
MSVPDMEADENGTWLAHTEGGASETRSWRIGAASPIVKLILVRPRTDDCCPSLEVSTQAKLVFPAHRSLAAERGARGMLVLYSRCCGLDIHQKTIVACMLLTDPDGATHRFVRTFGTMTADLLALGDWLEFHAVTHVAMESTGVLWRPVFNVLEEGRTLILVNAQHLKAATTDSPQWKQGGLDRHGRGDRSDPCVVRPAIAVA